MSTSKRRQFSRLFVRILGLILLALCGLTAVFLLWCATYGLIVDDVYMMGRFPSQRLHVHGVTAWFGAGIDYCLAAYLISIIVRFAIDPSLRRPRFHRFDRWLKYIFLGFVVGFVVAGIFTVHKR